MGLAAVPRSVNFHAALELGPRYNAEVSGLSGAADILSLLPECNALFR